MNDALKPDAARIAWHESLMVAAWPSPPMT